MQQTAKRRGPDCGVRVFICYIIIMLDVNLQRIKNYRYYYLTTIFYDITKQPLQYKTADQFILLYRRMVCSLNLYVGN